MVRVQELTETHVRRARAAAQQLHRPRLMKPVDVVHHLVGVQAQVPSSAGLGLRARAPGITHALVTRARVHDRSIVLTWAMRGTLHFLAAEDHDRFVPLVTEPRLANAMRRLRQEGVAGDRPARAVAAIERLLSREGQLTRAEIAEHLSRRGIRTEGQAIAHIVWLAAAERVICHGPDRDGELTFVLVRDWIGPPAAFDPDDALADLAVRYLRSHAPATPEDLAAWSGLRLGDARRAWRAIADRLIELDAPGGSTWTLRGASDEAPRGEIRLLPALDEYLLGWKDRSFAVAPAHVNRVNAGGGWLHPVVLEDGRAVGTWTMERTPRAVRVDVHPFSAPSRGLRTGVAAEGDELATFFGTPVETTVRPVRGARFDP